MAVQANSRRAKTTEMPARLTQRMWPRVLTSGAPRLFFNRVWSSVPEVREDLLRCAGFKHVVIAEEGPSDVGDQNMELLIPFFERLKENLHTYGISQYVIIDHHPAWRNSSVGIIQISANGNGSATGNGELPDLI